MGRVLEWTGGGKELLSFFSQIDSSAGTFKDAALGDPGNRGFKPPQFTAAAHSLSQEYVVLSEFIGQIVVCLFKKLTGLEIEWICSCYFYYYPPGCMTADPSSPQPSRQQQLLWLIAVWLVSKLLPHRQYKERFEMFYLRAPCLLLGFWRVSVEALQWHLQAWHIYYSFIFLMWAWMLVDVFFWMFALLQRNGKRVPTFNQHCRCCCCWAETVNCVHVIKTMLLT